MCAVSRCGEGTHHPSLMVENIPSQTLQSRKTEVCIVISSSLKSSIRCTGLTSRSSKNHYGTSKLVMMWGQIHRHRSISMRCVSCAAEEFSGSLHLPNILRTRGNGCGDRGKGTRRTKTKTALATAGKNQIFVSSYIALI